MSKNLRGIRRRIFAVLLCAAMMCSFIPTAFAGNLDPTSDAKLVSYDSAAEGIVLLENEGTLPLDTDSETVSVFGRSQINFIKGGGGSGDVNTTVLINFVEGMAEAGINYYEPLYADYQAWCTDNPPPATGILGGRPSNAEMPLTEAQVADAAGNSDVAVVVIGRNSTEGADRTETKGDWYLQDEEARMLGLVNAAFDEVVVILNIGSTIDMNWTEDYDSITAVIIGWQPGSYGTLAMGDVLAGKVVPSGHLVDTWAYDYSDYPASEYGTFGTNNTEDLDGDGTMDAVYGEDIYVGYRYFETFAPDEVRYEFGYGLSYTAFEQKVVGYSESDGVISVKVKVTNTGDTYSGKDVVQVYYSAPQGQLGKAAYELAAYGKTDELAPGKSQTLTISFNVNDMASYDDSGITGNKSCYVLEAGDYIISAGSSVKNLNEAGTYTVSSLTVTEELEEALAPTTGFSILTTGSPNSAGTYAASSKAASERTVDVSTKYDTDLPWYELRNKDLGHTAEESIMLGDVAKGEAELDDYIAQFTLEELAQLFGGTSVSSFFPKKAIGGAGVMGQTFTDYGVYVGTMADGPAGLRLTIGEGQTGNTAFPIATMLACTWNEELIEKVGEEIGKECAYNDVDIWLAPALNIHRDPLCGRNFEYYSEDPVISGTMTAATTRGVQSQGVGVTLKHYAANSQETDRMGSDSIVSERAMREIYLKGFEIAVKTSDPWYVMSSYNKINGSQAASNYELITQILREEWGFGYTVMTDWTGEKDNGNASMLRAQHDLSMPTLGVALPPGFEIAGAGWAAQVVCSSCGQAWGMAILLNFGWLTIDPTVPCESDECTRDNIVPEKDPADLADGYTYDPETGAISYDGKFVCTLEDWSNDTSGIIAGMLEENAVTMGEIERSAANIFTSLMQCLYFRTQNGLGKAEYTHGDNIFTVAKSDITETHSAYIDGYPDGTFGADKDITRAEVAQMLYNLGVEESIVDMTFTDVKEGDWFYDSVIALAKAGIVEGYGDGTFKPEESITRAEFVTIMVRYTKLTKGTGSPGFSDVDADHWAAGYIKAAEDARYVKGYPDGTFRPEKELSRAETVTIINRILDREGSADNIPSDLSIFPDVKRDHYAWADIVEAAVEHDYTIVNGNEVWA